MATSFNGTSQASTFTGGMNLDSDISVIKNTSYRYAENVEILSNTNGTATTVQGIEGFKALTDGYLEFSYHVYNSYNDENVIETAVFDPAKYKIIGIGVIRNYTCIFTEDLEDGTNSIFRLKIYNDVPSLFKIVTGNFNINDGEDRDLSIVTYWEDSDNIKVYWTDGVNSLRSINIAEDSDLTNFNKSETFFDNTIGIVTPQPIFDSFVSGNLSCGMIQYAYQLFNQNGAETKISSLSHLIHLTKSNAFDANYMGGEQGTDSGKSCRIKFEVSDNNFSRCKVYRIVYSSADELPMIYVAAEFLTSPIEEDGKQYQYYTDNGSILDEVTYEEFVTSDPYYFIPKVIESKDGRLFAANIIDDTWHLPDHTSDDWYDTRAFRFAYNSTNGYHARLTSISGSEKIIKYEHLINMAISEWKSFVPYDYDCINPFNHTFDTESLTASNAKYQWYWDNTTLSYKGGIGRNVSYKIVHTKFGEDFYKESSSSRSAWLTERDTLNGHSRYVNIDNRAGSHVGLEMYYNLPLNTSSNYESYDKLIDAINFGETGPLNYSNPRLDGKYRSYQRDEVYRFGVVFYNSTGQSTPVNWIGDIRMPSMTEKEHRLFDQFERIRKDVSISTQDSNVYQVVTYPMGLEFTFNNLPSDVKQIEIVRCERTFENRRIVYQGIISTLSKFNSQYRPPLCATYAQELYTICYRGDNATAPWSINYNGGNANFKPLDYFTFLSPELSYFPDTANEYAGFITGINLLYGMSSPTYPEDPAFSYLYNENARELFAHTYASQTWYRGEIASWDGMNRGAIGILADGLSRTGTGGYSYRGRSPMIIGYSYPSGGGGKSNDREIKSKWVSKLYNPFTSYYGRHIPSSSAESNVYHNLHDNVSEFKLITKPTFAYNLDQDQYEQVVEGTHKQPLGGISYQNWTLDKQTYWNGLSSSEQSSVSVNDLKMKHGPYADCILLHCPEFADKLPYFKRIGTTTDNGTVNNSDFYGQRNFFIPGTYNNSNQGLSSQTDKSIAYTSNATLLVNLIKISNYYGGDDYASRSNSTYISTNFIADVDNSSETIVVFGGDTYLGIAEVIQQHWYYLSDDPFPTEYDSKVGEKAQIAVYIPCESSINHHMVHGSTFNSYANTSYDAGNVVSPPIGGGTFPHELQRSAGAFPSGFIQEKSLYSYNTIYSTDSIVNKFVPTSIYNEYSHHFDYRVIYSQKKSNDEISDSWLKFNVADYLDTDTRFGSINNLKLFNNTLLFWQDSAFGELPVNERSLIQDNNQAQLLLGAGSVLTYYRYITQANGSRKDVINNVAVSPSSLYWYDHDRAEILSYSQSLEPITKTKDCQSWFNERKSTIGDRMITLYDKKYNKVHFRFTSNDDVRHLVFSEALGAFMCFLTYNSDWFIDLKDYYYSVKDNKLFKHNSSNLINLFFNGQEDSKITYVINDNYAQTKVFDNIEYYAEFNNPNNLSFYFQTTTQDSSIIEPTDIDLREDTYKFAIPRSKITTTNYSTIAPVYNDRMRGKYLISYLTFKPNNGDTIFKLPYIKTSYRISNI